MRVRFRFGGIKFKYNSRIISEHEMSASGLDGRKTNKGNTEVLLRHRHQWPKGVSGNPSGRTRDSVDIADLCRRYGQKAYETIVALMDDPNPKIRLAASQEILTRAYGKPPLHTTSQQGAQTEFIKALQAATWTPRQPLVDITPPNEKLRLSEEMKRSHKT
jgi:hypothetical protein